MSKFVGDYDSGDDEQMSTFSAHSHSGDERDQGDQIKDEISKMSFEEMMKLKEELGTKMYKAAVLQGGSKSTTKSAKIQRLNKNRPREMSTRRQVPFLGITHTQVKKETTELRDPRFDENAGTYNVKHFKENYKFLSKIRQNEIGKLRKQLTETEDETERRSIKEAMQRLTNKNNEEEKWHEKEKILKQEQKEIQQAHAEGRQPHYTTKKERRAKELVQQFERLKKEGQLNKHLEKRRKKNAAKDRKKISFD